MLGIKLVTCSVHGWLMVLGWLSDQAGEQAADEELPVGWSFADEWWSVGQSVEAQTG